MTGLALEDLRVVELAEGVAGPFCTKLLADYGADVLKVEPPGGDHSRHHGPFPGETPHPERSGQFLYLNGNKRGAVIDITTPEGRAALIDLVRSADIFVTDLPPRQLDELNLNYADLVPADGRLIMLAISPFGQTGPYRNYAATDLTLFHLGGMGRETPYNELTDLDLPPLRAGGYQAEYVTGLTGASAVMVGVAHRTAYGTGQLIDLGAMESVANMMRSALANYTYNPDVFTPSRLKSGWGWTMPCKDGYLSFWPFSFDHWWKGFVEMMGNPEWATNEVFNTAEGRTANADIVEMLSLEWMAGQSRDEVYEMALARGIACFPVNTMADVASSRQFRAREFLREVDHPETGPLLQPGPPFRFTGTPWTARRPAPLLGQHTREVLESWAGYTPERVDALKSRGVVATREVHA